MRTATKKGDPVQRQVITTAEFAAMLGKHEDTVRAAVRRGELPTPIYIGGKMLWNKTAIEAFLSGTAGPMTQAATAPPAGRERGRRAISPAG